MGDGYPIVLDVKARRIVIVGGGNVALRKVRGLLECGATDITVVSPAFHPDLPADRIRRVTETYSAARLAGAAMVFAATDSPQVNAQVVQDGHAIGALVCRADVDEDHAGDFATPAMVRRGPVMITASSGGSPALSAAIRDQLARSLDERLIAMAEAMLILRPMLRSSLEPARRKEAFRSLCTEQALGVLASGGLEGLKMWLSGQFGELKSH